VECFVGLLVAVLCAYSWLDGLAGHVDVQPVAPPEMIARSEHARVFVLFVDSLRYETAMDERLMPRLAELRKRSTFARVTTTRDAVTVPAVRAAFTGRERTAILGFVGNFLRSEAGVESIFRQVTRAGLRTAVFSEGAFDQFGDDVTDRYPNRGVGPNAVDAQNDGLKTAVKDFRAHRHELVVAHINYTDLVAHERGIAHDLYAASFRVVDEIIERIAAIIPSKETSLGWIAFSPRSWFRRGSRDARSRARRSCAPARS
jgi:hypothetical protein